MSEALEILQQRLARGEIDVDEFNARRAALTPTIQPQAKDAFTGSVSSGLGWIVIAVVCFIVANFLRGGAAGAAGLAGIVSVVIAILMFVLPKERR